MISGGRGWGGIEWGVMVGRKKATDVGRGGGGKDGAAVSSSFYVSELKYMYITP
jgi:hypothetical protein